MTNLCRIGTISLYLIKYKEVFMKRKILSLLMALSISSTTLIASVPSSAKVVKQQVATAKAEFTVARRRSAALLSEFGLGHVREYAPFGLILSALHLILRAKSQHI